MYQPIGDVHDPRQIQAFLRRMARLMVKRDCFHDRIGKTPQAQKISADLRMMRFHLRRDVCADGRISQ